MVDYEKVDKLVENCKKLYPDIPDYCLWVLACDYYINEEKDEEDEDEKEKREQIKKEALENFLNAKKEFETTKYDNIFNSWYLFILKNILY
jgi:L-arabinose isomerase